VKTAYLQDLMISSKNKNELGIKKFLIYFIKKISFLSHKINKSN
jgi:hypothetical protein